MAQRTVHTDAHAHSFNSASYLPTHQPLRYVNKQGEPIIAALWSDIPECSRYDRERVTQRVLVTER
jgi:hypothetical protein